MGATISDKLDRALLLYHQSRYDDALRVIAEGLAIAPDDSDGHAMAALCLSGKGDHHGSERSARRAIALAPDSGFAHFSLTRVLLQAGRPRDAEVAAREALRLSPRNPDSYAGLAAALIDLRRCKEALSVAEQGLRCDAQHTACINLRAIALSRLGARDDAASAIRGALAVDPEDAITHANMGLTLLRAGQVEQALPYFREALRLEPSLGIAREGVMEVLRARNPVYRAMLRYMFWMDALNQRSQWIVIVGLYFGFRVVRSIAYAWPEARPFAFPFLVLYGLFALLSWTAKPFANLLLRMDPLGRMLLNRGQMVASNIIGICAFCGLAALAAYLIGGAFPMLLLTVVGLGLIIPVAGAYGDGSRPPSRIMVALCAILLMLGAGSLAAYALAGEDASLALLALFGMGALLSNFVAVGVSATRR